MNKCFFFLLILTSSVHSQDTFINPVTDICWECVFPMKILGQEVEPNLNTISKPPKLKNIKGTDLFCYCHGVPPKPGIPISFWEPSKMVDVTKQAYKLVGLGGISIGQSTIKNRGTLGSSRMGSRKSFSHVHIYDYPVLALLDILTDFACIETGTLDMQYFSELDYTWYDDSLANIINPEVALFANPLAQAACVADCAGSSINQPLDKLFWCAGCQGSLYPFSGHVGSFRGLIQESLLLTQRALAKMHRTGMITGYESGNYCERSYMPIWKKSLYKIQMARPVANTSDGCTTLGGTEVIWGAGKAYPKEGEEFVYILWTKKQCCLDAIKIGASASGSGGSL